MIKSLVKQSITAKLKRFTAASTWVGTHPFSWRRTAESGCSSSSKQPCLHQRHNKTQTQNARAKQNRVWQVVLLSIWPAIEIRMPRLRRQSSTAVIAGASAESWRDFGRTSAQWDLLSAQLPYPRVWYPPPFPRCSFSLVSVLLTQAPSIAIPSPLSNDEPLPPARRLSKFGFQEATSPPLHSV